MSIINLMPYNATSEQITAGVVDLPADMRTKVRQAYAFTAPPSLEMVGERAAIIAGIAATFADTVLLRAPDPVRGTFAGLLHTSISTAPDGAATVYALIDGPAYMVSALEPALCAVGIRSVYPFSPAGIVGLPEDATP